MALWNYCTICGKRIEVGEPCLGIEKKNTEIVGDSICFDCVKVENIPGREESVPITDLLARAEAAERKVKDLEQALSDASKIVKTMQESTIPFYRRRAEAAEESEKISKEAIEISVRENARLLKKVEEADARAEKAERERDAAVKDLYIAEDCDTCRSKKCVPRGGSGKCRFEWRGQKEE